MSFGSWNNGPGFQIPYFEGQEQADEEILLQEFKKALDSLHFKGIIFLEAGRFLAAPCGSYLTRVADVKRRGGARDRITALWTAALTTSTIMVRPWP